METSYTATETSPLFSSALANNKGISVTISRIQKGSLGCSLTQLVDNSDFKEEDDTRETQPLVAEQDENKNNEEPHIMDAEEIAKAQEQRRSLLDALINALTNFTSQFSEEEGSEVVAAVLKSHLSRFHPQSKSFDISRPRNGIAIRTSNTLQCFTVEDSEPLVEDRETFNNNPISFLSPTSHEKSPDDPHSYSENESSTSEKINKLTNSTTWRQWSEMKRDSVTGQNTHESLTLLLDDNSNSDDDDVIYL